MGAWFCDLRNLVHPTGRIIFYTGEAFENLFCAWERGGLIWSKTQNTTGVSWQKEAGRYITARIIPYCFSRLLEFRWILRVSKLIPFQTAGYDCVFLQGTFQRGMSKQKTIWWNHDMALKWSEPLMNRAQDFDLGQNQIPRSGSSQTAILTLPSPQTYATACSCSFRVLHRSDVRCAAWSLFSDFIFCWHFYEKKNNNIQMLWTCIGIRSWGVIGHSPFLP